MLPPFREIIRIKENCFRFQCFVNSSSNTEENYINVHPHWHDMVEILYVLKGRAVQHIGGRLFEVGQGDIIIIQSESIHGTYSEKETDIGVYQFTNSFFNTEEHPIAEMCDIFNNRLDLAFPISTDSFPGTEIKQRLDAVGKAFDEKDPGWEFSVMAELAGIMSICFKCFNIREPQKKSSKGVKESLMKVFEYVKNNYTGKILLSDVVKITNYSTPHFCRIFRESLGMSFIEYLNRYRIEASLKKLTGDTAITTIALDGGFQSVNSYIREFGKIKGISPGRFRANERKLIDTKGQ